MRLPLACVALLVFLSVAYAQDTQYPPDADQIPGPAKPEDHAKWLAEVKRWRHERLTRIGYVGREYERPELKWTQSSFIQPQSMIEDRYFYDPVTRKYTVDRYLDDLEKRYGGIDSVLLWPVYPNIGIDDRNQHDLLRDMPGGIEGLKQMVADFHRRGVKVLFPVMPWDVGTRDEGEPLWSAAAKLMAQIGADGINGDTFSGMPRAFRSASDATGHIIALEPENPLQSDEGVAWQNLTWGYWKYPFVPSISKLKWLERRHMVNVCRRWARDKTDDLQYAFFNGVGYESWENIWGIWNEITPRDAEALRRIASIERQFASLLVSSDWEPHTPVEQFGVFASKWPSANQTLWTMVNRNQYDVSGIQVRVPSTEGARFFDVYSGHELKPEIAAGKAALRFSLEANGFGALLMTSGAPPADLAAFLAKMRQMSEKPLRSYSHEWKPLPQQIVETRSTKPPAGTPENMVRIPGNPPYEFRVSGVMIEGSNDVGTGVQYPWEPSPRRHHLQTMTMRPFWIDKYPVTNAQFRQFLAKSNYRPADDHNFLRDWRNGTYPDGWASKPVTWVSLEDARAYAEWAGKRLPHEWEWQYAAQGNDGRTYPWGNEPDAAAMPLTESGRVLGPPSDVAAHPKGASPFGVMDMVGNVWQWTDEYVDEHTRSGMLRGGSHYRPAGSLWYFPQAQRLDQHGKYLLISPGKDRSGTVGFRCVMDAE